MDYVWEFEFVPSKDGQYICAFPAPGIAGGATYGASFVDALANAYDFLLCLIDDALMHNETLPEARFDNQPQRGGRMIPIFVRRDLEDIPAMMAADAARYLGVSPARVDQLIKAGYLDSWRDGTKRMVSKASLDARKEELGMAGSRHTAPTLDASDVDVFLGALNDAREQIDDDEFSDEEIPDEVAEQILIDAGILKEGQTLEGLENKVHEHQA